MLIHMTKQGNTFDSIAFLRYGSTAATVFLVEANEHLAWESPLLPINSKVFLPEWEDRVEKQHTQLWD